MGKGIDCYGYKANNLNASLNFNLIEPNGEKKSFQLNNSDSVEWHNFEVETSFLHPFTDGKYSFEVNGKVEGKCDISPISGLTSNCTMCDMLANQQCKTIEGVGILSYGFYDSGGGYDSGKFPYTRHEQSYAYLGDEKRPNWMKELVSNNTGLNEAPFSVFVLPGAHDAGMNTSENITKIVDNFNITSAIGTAIAAWLASAFTIALSAVIAAITALASSVIQNILVGLGVTQKDSITDMLNMGTRYFDFRPGYAADITGVKSAIGDGLFHQHYFLPGMDFVDFLNEIVAWLDQHSGEIVVISLGFAGFYDDAMKPDPDVLTSKINAAISNNNSSLVTGNIHDASKSYKELISANKRLLFFNNQAKVNDADKYDSYNKSYQTLDPQNIITALEKMDPIPPKSNFLYTVLQLQGTANGVSALWPTLIYNEKIKGTAAQSPLLMTKGKFDFSTYRWAKNNLQNFSYQYPLVILNDFVDPAMSHISETATLERFNQFNLQLTHK